MHPGISLLPLCAPPMTPANPACGVLTKGIRKVVIRRVTVENEQIDLSEVNQSVIEEWPSSQISRFKETPFTHPWLPSFNKTAVASTDGTYLSDYILLESKLCYSTENMLDWRPQENAATIQIRKHYLYGATSAISAWIDKTKHGTSHIAHKSINFLLLPNTKKNTK